MESENVKTRADEKESINYIEILKKYLSYWRWIVGSVIICLFVAFLYLRYTTPVYQIYSTILLKDDTRGGGVDELSTLQSWGIMRGFNSNVDNEIEILSSWNLTRTVVNELGLHTYYYYEGRVRNLDIYNSTPIFVSLPQISLDTLSYPIQLRIEMELNGKISIKGKQHDIEFGGDFDQLPTQLDTPAGTLSFALNTNSEPDYNRAVLVDIFNPINAALYWRGNLGISTTSKMSTVLQLVVNENIPQRGIDFLNALIDAFNRDGVDDKNKSAISMGLFIDERLGKIASDLDEIKRDLEDYKRTEKITELKINSDLSLQTNNQYQRELVKINTQINLVKFLEEYMTENSDIERLVPSNLGILDPILQTLILDYNKTLQERDRLLRGSSSENPNVVAKTHTIKALHRDMVTSISGVIQGLEVSRKDMIDQSRMYDNIIGSVPKQERELTEKMRNQKVLEDLFLILSRRKEENNLTLAVPVNKAKIIDDAMSTSRPVSPRRKIVFLIALLAGLVIPVGGIYLYELLNYRLISRRELEKLTDVPILGEIPISESNDSVAVKEGVNDSMAEAFRALRTNLLFTRNKKMHQVIMATSSMPGEGKTFIAINLALSLATINKKVLLVGLDVRKPMLGVTLNLDSKHGVTNYLAGFQSDVARLIQQSVQHENLFVMTSGVIPPNPAELLQSERLDELIDILRKDFDYIIIDSAPIGLVTDSLILNRITDAVIYVARSQYTNKAHLEWLNDIHKEGKLPCLSVVLNAVKMDNIGHYGYGNGSYGYDSLNV